MGAIPNQHLGGMSMCENCEGFRKEYDVMLHKVVEEKYNPSIYIVKVMLLIEKYNLVTFT